MPFRSTIKALSILLLPLLLFFVLLIPYSWLNKSILVDWLGCGCPRINEYGETVTPTFDANDFTRVFWSAISACVVSISAFFSKKFISENKKHLRIVYVLSMLAISVFISYNFCQVMAWK